MVMCPCTILCDCLLVPIPKGNKDPTLSDNYRLVALAPTLSKAVYWCILQVILQPLIYN